MYGKITPSRARVVKSVDTADLKSAAYKTGMPVRFRPRAPKLDETPLYVRGFFILKVSYWALLAQTPLFPPLKLDFYKFVSNAEIDIIFD